MHCYAGKKIQKMSFILSEKWASLFISKQGIFLEQQIQSSAVHKKNLTNYEQNF